MTSTNDRDKDLIYCKICGKPKQMRRTMPGGQTLLINIGCACDREKWANEEEEKQRREKKVHIKRLRKEGLPSDRYQACTFDRVCGNEDARRQAMDYVAHFSEMEAMNMGMLFWGGVGSGKTFLAACVANALIDMEVSVHMTSISIISNAMDGVFSDDKNRYLNELNQCRLLIIDDLGVERTSDYSLEQLYSVINSRYLSGKPLIVTTNLMLDQIRNPNDLMHHRIYSRILEMCVPVMVDDHDRREDIASANSGEMRSLLENKALPAGDFAPAGV
jgi:DNA replication protein DnaC